MRDVTRAWRDLGSTPSKQFASLLTRLDARVVGIAGPPGAGKSTFAHAVADGIDELVISMDDFYLSRAERSERGLTWRGPPGSHDVTALIDVLDALRAEHAPVTVPRFSAEIDDRVEPVVVDRVPGRVLVEGWVLGHRADGYEEILDRLDLLMFLDVPVQIARTRRFAREQSLRGGFSAAQMQRFWDEVLEPGLTKWVREAHEAADVVLKMPGDVVERALTRSDAVEALLENPP
jgi:uridine kinase